MATFHNLSCLTIQHCSCDFTQQFHREFSRGQLSWGCSYMHEIMNFWVSVLCLYLVFFAGVLPSLFEILFGFGCGSIRGNGGDVTTMSFYSTGSLSLAPSHMAENGTRYACASPYVVLRWSRSPSVVADHHFGSLCKSLLSD